MKVLIVAEKDTVATAIAEAVLKANVVRAADHYVGDAGPAKILITWANGHAAQLCDPESYNPAWGSPWRDDVLPVAPPGFAFRYEPTNPSLVSRIASWASRSDEVVNACDAGREGELIFHEIWRHCTSVPPKAVLSRMWITSTTREGLKRAWEERDNALKRHYQDMLVAALSRQQGDWLWGINLTRKVSLVFGRRYPRKEGSGTYHIGRVQTPVLHVVRSRCQKVETFVSERFFRLHGDFSGPEGPFRAKIVAFAELRHGNVDTHFRAMSHVQEIKRQLTLVMQNAWDTQDVIEPAPSSPPPPFNLDDLQESANLIRTIGFGAKRTLDLAQVLYHKEKAITYPRTESFHFPEAMRSEVLGVRDVLWREWGVKFFPALKDMVLPPAEDRWFDDGKVGDHHAIMPTGIIPDPLDYSGHVRPEFILWQLVTMRFLHAWLPDAIIQTAQRVLLLPANPEGTVFYRAFLTCAPVQAPGWMEVEEKTFNTRGHGVPLAKLRLEKLFPPCSTRKAKLNSLWVDEGSTTRPEFHNDAMLLRDMRGAGLGTPATRAGCIEELLSRGYLYRNLSNRLRVAEDGNRLLSLLEEFGVDRVADPELTASWEKQLERMEKRVAEKPTRELFLGSVLDEAKRALAILDGAKDGPDVVFCPDTGNRVTLSPDGKRWQFGGKYKSASCYVTLRGRKMSGSDYRNIFVADRKGGGPFTFVSRNQQPYDCYVIWRSRAHGFDQWEFKFKRRSRTAAPASGRSP